MGGANVSRSVLSRWAGAGVCGPDPRRPAAELPSMRALLKIICTLRTFRTDESVRWRAAQGQGQGHRGVRYMLNGVDMTVTQARAEFADLVNRVAYTGEPVVLTRRG